MAGEPPRQGEAGSEDGRQAGRGARRAGRGAGRSSEGGRGVVDAAPPNILQPPPSECERVPSGVVGLCIPDETGDER